MLVYMTETRRGSPDGFMVKRYEEARTYDLPHTLACTFLRMGAGIRLEEEDLPFLTLSAPAEIIPLPNRALRGVSMPGMEAVRQSEGV